MRSELLQNEAKCIEAIKALEIWFDNIATIPQHQSDFSRILVESDLKEGDFDVGNSSLGHSMAVDVKPHHAKEVSELFYNYFKNSTCYWEHKWNICNHFSRAIIIAIDIILLLTLFDSSTVYAKLMSAEKAYTSLVSNRLNCVEVCNHEVALNLSTLLPHNLSLLSRLNSHLIESNFSCTSFAFDECDTKFINAYLIKRYLLTHSHNENPCQNIKLELVKNGEEFEYYFPESQPRFLTKKAKLALLHRWRTAIQDKLTLHSINRAHCKIVLDEQKLSLTYQIGAWQASLFFDNWHKHTLPEVNVSPYKLGQLVKLKGHKISIENLFSWFITEIAQTLGLKASSGHKHIDLTKAVGYNPEFYFRLLVDVENKAWLTQCFKTEEFSADTWKYLAQDPSVNLNILLGLLDAFNELLLAGYTGKSVGSFSDNKEVLQLFDLAWGVGNYFVKYRPVKIPAEFGFDYGTQVADAEKGHIVSHPKTTIEFRFFNCARTGQEAIKLSKMILAWIAKISKEQKNATPLLYDPIDPSIPIEHVKLKRMFDEFIVTVCQTAPVLVN
ncbi:hypothetical protein [Parashewanella curva]|nr:hypothetical protein [Parashewanella curva]